MPPENNPQPTTDNRPPQTPNPQLKQIRTFQGDVATALGRQNESLVSIQQNEASRRRVSGLPSPAESEAAEGKRRDFAFLLLGSLFFIIVGLAGAWYGYREYLSRTAPPVLVVPENRFIAPNSEVSLDISGLNRESFALKFKELVRGTPRDELKHVMVRSGALETSAPITTAELLTLLENRAPGSLVRAFDKLFMTGTVGENPFIIIKLTSFENAFAGMLAWEENLAEDLTPVFSNAERVKAIAPGSVFKDVILRNKDVRVMEIGVTSPQSSEATSTPRVFMETVLLYSFFDNNMLIITNRLDTLQTLIDRLTRERLSR
jgi:hypothetical protein